MPAGKAVLRKDGPPPLPVVSCASYKHPLSTCANQFIHRTFYEHPAGISLLAGHAAPAEGVVPTGQIKKLRLTDMVLAFTGLPNLMWGSQSPPAE